MKKLMFVGLPLLIVVVGLHFVPVYSKTVTACAPSPVVKNGRMIFGSTASGIDSQLQALESFNSTINCPKSDITYKLFVL